MSINAIVSNLWIAILISLLAVVCNLQDVSHDYDHGGANGFISPCENSKVKRCTTAG